MIRKLALGSSDSVIGFTTTGSESWNIWDRFLTIEGKPAYHIGNVCNTCRYFFERLQGANRSIQPDIAADVLASGSLDIESDLVRQIGKILPQGQYVPNFRTDVPKLVRLGSPDDYFATDQPLLWGTDAFWGLPHHPKIEYYRFTDKPLGDGRVLFEFLVPMFPHAWLKRDDIERYQHRDPHLPSPIAIGLSVLDVKQPAVWENALSVSSHFCLTHYILDGHHKLRAASLAGRPVSILSYLAPDRGVSSPSEVELALGDGSSRT